MTCVCRPLAASIAVVAAAACLLGLAARAAATPERVKVGPNIYVQGVDSTADQAGALDFEPPTQTGAGRIVGGGEATIADYPWQVGVAFNQAVAPGNNGFQRQFCGGTLVAPQIVITAAHCLYVSAVGGFPAPASVFTAITGRTTLSTSEGQEIDWTGYYYFTDSAGNPLFNPATYDYDAVFITLATPSGSPPIKVAGADEAATWAAGRRAWISGWGDTASGANDFQDVLRAAQVQIVDDATCADPASYGADFHAELMVCAGVAGGGVDTCQGDSGGPLVVPVVGGASRASGTWRLVGDTSWGIGCAEAQFPGIYGRIAGGTAMGDALRQAIQSVTGEDVYGSGARPAEPPGVTITKRPKDRTKTKGGKLKAKVKYRFESNDPGADFTCELDNKRPKRCNSPYKKNLKKGRHEVSIVATNFLGESGRAATDKFRIKRKRK
jgi:hypothetical protein